MSQVTQHTSSGYGMDAVAQHIERAGSGLGYGLWAGFLGALALATVYLALASLPLVLVGVGALLLPLLVGWTYRLASLFAEKASYALGYRLITPVPPTVTGSLWQRFLQTSTQAATYRGLLWALFMGLTGVLAGSLILVVVFGFARELTVPLWWWVLPEGTANSALGFPISSWAHALSTTATAPLYLAAALWILPAVCTGQARLCAWVLGCTPVTERTEPAAHSVNPAARADQQNPEPTEPTHPTDSVDSRLERLSPREAEVLDHMAAGLDNAAIAEHLVVSQAAVLKHIRSIFVKLDLPPGETGHRRVRAVLIQLGADAAAPH